MLEKNLTEKNTHVYQVQTHARAQVSCPPSGGLSRPDCSSSDRDGRKENPDGSGTAAHPNHQQIYVNFQQKKTDGSKNAAICFLPILIKPTHI